MSRMVSRQLSGGSEGGDEADRKAMCGAAASNANIAGTGAASP